MTFGKLGLGLNLGQGNLGFGVNGNGLGFGNGNGFGHGNGVGHGHGNGRDRDGDRAGPAAGGNAGLNFNLNLNLGLNLNVGAAIGLGGLTASLDASTMMRSSPNEQNDPDAIARLQRQSQGLDQQTGRESGQNYSARAGQATGLAAPGAPAGPAGPALPGVGVGVNVALGQGGGGTTTAGGFGTMSGQAGASVGQPSLSTASLDRVVTALADQGPAQIAQRGPGVTSEAASIAQQAQPGVAVSLPTNGDPMPAVLAQRADAAAMGVAATNNQEHGARPATTALAAVPQTTASGPLPTGPQAAPQQAGPQSPATAQPGPQQTPVAAQVGGPQQATVTAQVGTQPAATVAQTSPGAVQQAAGPQVQAALQAGPAHVAAAVELPIGRAAAQGQQAQAPAVMPIGPTPTTLQPGVVEVKPQPVGLAPSPAQIGTEAAFAGALAPSTGGAPVTGAFGQPIEPVAALGPRAAGEAVVQRQIAAVEKTERTSGSAAALRELNNRLREMPAESTSKVLAGLAPMLGRAADAFAGNQSTGRVEKVNGILERSSEEVSARASMVRTGADLATALDAGSMEGMTGHVTKDVARAIASGDRSVAERAIAFGQAVAFGSGLSLPFALIEAYDEQGDSETARQLEMALAGGLARLLQRLHEAVDALSSAAGPVAFEWAAWRSAGVAGPELERRLRKRLQSQEGLIKEIDEAIDAVDSAGGDMVRALERLSRWSARTPEIVAIWREATASRKTAFAIAQSLTAQHVIAQALAAGLRSEPPGAPDEFSVEAAQELYERFGFPRDGAAELAEISLARHEAIQMTGGWVRARKAHDPSAEAAFARIVAFLKGHCAPSNRHIETVTFADLDPDGERPITLVGAPLLERFELMEAA